MRRALSSTLLTLCLLGRVNAHRLDEYLQATLIGVTQDGIELEVHLTPGVAILPAWIAVIDQDRDGRISPEEQKVYVECVLRDLELRVDGVSAPLSLVESSFPTLDAARVGLGTIAIRVRSTRRGHMLRFENRHLPQVSAYLVNCLTNPADRLVINRQERDEAQRSIQFEYSLEGDAPRTAWLALGPFWPAAIGMLLVARVAVLIYRVKSSKSAAQ